MLKLIQKNSVPSYEEFYTENQPRVLRYVRGKLDSPEDAEDLVSAVFTYCFEHYGEYDPEKSAITTWLYLIVNSRVKNYYRDHGSSRYADYETVSQVMEDQNIDLDQGVYLEQLRSRLMRAIDRLPERQRQIVLLSYFQNASSEEIAKKLGTTPGNVRVLLSRALKKLSAEYENDWKEFINHG